MIGFVALVAAVLSLGCGREASDRTAGDVPEQSAGDASLAAQAILRGALVWGHEVHSFTACGSSAEHWVLDGTGGEVRRIYEELAPGPYERIFVELRASQGPVPETGFGADYEGSVSVAEVRRAEYEGHGCGENLADLEFRALGVEPFWSLTIDRLGLALRRPDPPEPTRWPRVGRELGGAAIRYLSDTEEAGRIEVVLVEARCIDPMAGSYFPFSAEVRTPTDTLRGCALQGDLTS